MAYCFEQILIVLLVLLPYFHFIILCDKNERHMDPSQGRNLYKSTGKVAVKLTYTCLSGTRRVIEGETVRSCAKLPALPRAFANHAGSPVT